MPSPNTCVNDFQEELACFRIENEDGSVDGLGGEISFMSLVNCHSVDICVVNKPDDLV